MIFLDSNVPMYLVGPDGPHKARVRQVLARLAQSDARLVTDAEVYQEILHRYHGTIRRRSVQAAFDVVDSLADEVFAVERSHVVAAKTIAESYPHLSARDAVHVAVMRAAGVSRVLSFDRDFDAVVGIERLGE
ncbi:MAG: type II toxin-antitoxin system VapC family toxin [Sporichthyaceae bacterium]